MNIQKVSKHVIVSTPSRSGEGKTSRKILISIPRLRWLESDDTEYYKQYKVIREIEQPEKSSKAQKINVRKTNLVGKPLTEREKVIWAMISSGVCPKDAAAALKIHASTLRKTVTRIKDKKGLRENVD